MTMYLSDILLFSVQYFVDIISALPYLLYISSVTMALFPASSSGETKRSIDKFECAGSLKHEGIGQSGETSFRGFCIDLANFLLSAP
jgi:hypothetical protein